MTEKLTGQQVLDADLADWRLMVRSLHARFATGDFATGLGAGQRDRRGRRGDEPPPRRRPALPAPDVRLTSHDVGAVTERDVELARRISAAAADARGGRASRAAVSVSELGARHARTTTRSSRSGRRCSATTSTRPTTTRSTTRPAGADPVVPGHRAARRAAAALPPRRLGAARRRRGAARRRARRRRHAGQRRRGAGVLGARRRRRQQGLHLHLAGPRRLSVATMWDRRPSIWDG